VQPAVGDPGSAERLDQTIPRGPFQPIPFCDSVISFMTSLLHFKRLINCHVCFFKIKRPSSTQKSKEVLFVTKYNLIAVFNTRGCYKCQKPK